MENLDHDPSILTRRAQHQLLIFTTYEEHPRVHDNSRMLLHVYEGTFLIMYVSLIGFIQVKSQNKNYSPFETHIIFIIMSVIALPIAVITSGKLFYTIDPLKHTNKKNFSRTNYTLLESAFAFSTILAPLSLVLVLFIPLELNWIGYGIICVLFVIMVANNFRGHLQIQKKKEMSNFASHQMV